MKPVPVTIYDGTNATTVNRINAPAGSVDPNGVLDLEQGLQQYIALVSQATTAAPTSTVIKNTFSGTPAWAYTSAGIYTLTLTGAWTANKTIVQWTNGVIADPTSDGIVTNVTRTSGNVLTFNAVDDAGAAANWHCTASSLVITVYP